MNCRKLLVKLGFKRERCVDVMNEMCLDYMDFHHWIPPSGEVVISRAVFGPYRDCPRDELLQKPIPAAFVARIQKLFPKQKVIVSEKIFTEQDLAREREWMREAGGDY